MYKALEPTRDPGWVLTHDGYNVLTESAVESRFAFSNGFLGMRAARALGRGPTWVAWLGTFLMAAKLLGCEPARAVVIEDAIAGVQAGANGGFGLVIGIARKGNAEELKRNGAQVVVNDLSELADPSNCDVQI